MYYYRARRIKRLALGFGVLAGFVFAMFPF